MSTGLLLDMGLKVHCSFILSLFYLYVDLIENDQTSLFESSK